MFGARGVAFVLVFVTGTLAGGVIGQQESAALSRLALELDTLRHRLDFETDQLQQRVDRLETRLRQQQSRRAVPAPPAPEARPSGWADGSPARLEVEEVSARRFVVRDASGKTRAVLADSDRFGPMLALLDDAEDVRVLLAQPDAGTGQLEMFDARQGLRLRMALEGAGPNLRLYDRQGSARVSILVEDGSGAVTVEPRR